MNVTIETALEEIRRVLAAAGPRNECDTDTVAAAYSVLCAERGAAVTVVAGDKTASAVYVDGRRVDD